MALILKESDVASVLTMREAVGLVEQAFRLHAEGKTALAPRLIMNLSGDAGNFRIMAAVVPDVGGFGLKTLTGVPGKRPADQTFFAMLYFDRDTGALLAVIPATHITGTRTGAASGVATKYLARADAKIVGIFGAGFQGRAQLAAVREVRQIEQVKIYDLSKPKAAEWAAALSAEGLKASVAPSPEATVRGSDIVLSATTSNEPVILGEWLEEGMHINSIGANAATKREVDVPAMKKSVLVVDFKEQALQEAGDLMAAFKSGALTDADIHAEIGDVVVGRRPGRQSPREITLFKSVGVAIEDVAVAAWVYREAKARGLGTSISLQD